MLWVADYSFARPSLAGLKAAGCSGIARYATDVPGGGHKAIDAAELAEALRLGLDVVIVQEGGAQPALRGFPGGVADARAANSRMDSIGYPGNCWLYYAAEDPTKLSTSQWPTVRSYFQGVNSVPGRPVGGYGSKALLDYLGGAGLITRKWAVGPWGGFAGCHLSQYSAPVPQQFAGAIDANLIVVADYGQAPRAMPAPQPVTPNRVGEDAMLAVKPGEAVTVPDIGVDGVIGISYDQSGIPEWPANGVLVRIAVGNEADGFHPVAPGEGTPSDPFDWWIGNGTTTYVNRAKGQLVSVRNKDTQATIGVDRA